MKRAWLLLLAACSPTETPVAPSLTIGSPEARAYIVSLARGTNPQDIAHAVGVTPRFVYRHALVGFAADVPDVAVEALRRNPNVLAVDRVGTVQASAVPSWGLDRIDQRNLPLNGAYGAPNTGAGVRVYVLDTGVLEHPELLNRAGSGYDAIDNDMDASDCHSHGTHVAGTVAGTTVGVAREATIISVRMLDCGGSGTTDQVVAAIDWLIANHQKPAVVNASWGGGVDPPLDAAVAAAVNAGITWVSAAGNSNADACNYSPAREPASITSGASDAADARAYFSNYGTCVDLFAPGLGINSLFFLGGYTSKSGTSMASPHVAGVAALYLAANPLASPAAVRAAITGAATVGALSSVGVGSPNFLLYNGVAGAGVLSVLPRPNPSVRPVPSFVAPVHVTAMGPQTDTGKGYWWAGVQVSVRDGAGNPVYIVSVELEFTGGYTGTCNLGFDGSCVAWRAVKNNQKSVTATIRHVNPVSLYDPSANLVSSVVIRKP